MQSGLSGPRRREGSLRRTGTAHRPGSPGLGGQKWCWGGGGQQEEARMHRATNRALPSGPRRCSVQPAGGRWHAQPHSAGSPECRGAEGAVLRGSAPRTEGACPAPPTQPPGKIHVLGVNRGNWRTPGPAEARAVPRNERGLGRGQRVPR